MSPVIRIAAAVITNDSGHILLVRKRGTTVFMQPGGKLEPGERPADTLARELNEELGYVLDPTTFEHWGRFGADAANEAGHVVDCDIYRVHTDQVPVVAAEIDELAWVDAGSTHGLALAPLLVEQVLPRLARDGSEG
jgi:8-oxo-dGTP pyrophosphatase MutT (NUDIX family)